MFTRKLSSESVSTVRTSKLDSSSLRNSILRSAKVASASATSFPTTICHDGVSSRCNRISPSETQAILLRIASFSGYLSFAKAKKLKLLYQKIEQSLIGKEQLSALSSKELCLIACSFKAISSLLPKCDEAELAFIMSRLFKAEYLEANKDLNRLKQYKKYFPFRCAGSEVKKELSVSAGLGLGLPFVAISPEISTNCKLSGKRVIYANDEGQFVR